MIKRVVLFTLTDPGWGAEALTAARRLSDVPAVCALEAALSAYEAAPEHRRVAEQFGRLTSGEGMEGTAIDFPETLRS